MVHQSCNQPPNREAGSSRMVVPALHPPPRSNVHTRSKEQEENRDGDLEARSLVETEPNRNKWGGKQVSLLCEVCRQR